MFKTVFSVLRQIVMAFLLLFLALALAWTLFDLPISAAGHAVTLPAIIGFAGGLFFFSMISRFTPLYVIGHELTHWLIAKLFRRRTQRFEIHRGGGSVAVERPNIWIVLGPYFLPIHAVFWLGLCGFYRFWRGPLPQMQLNIAAAITGVAYAYHLVMTARALMRKQPDIENHGAIISLPLIICANVLVLFLTFVVAGRYWHSAFVMLNQRLYVQAYLVRNLLLHLRALVGW